MGCAPFITSKSAFSLIECKNSGPTKVRYWRTSGVSAPIVMKIGGWKKSSTVDIYLRLAVVDTKGATDCLEFIPSEIKYF